MSLTSTHSAIVDSGKWGGREGGREGRVTVIVVVTVILGLGRGSEGDWYRRV